MTAEQPRTSIGDAKLDAVALVEHAARNGSNADFVALITGEDSAPHWRTVAALLSAWLAAAVPTAAFPGGVEGWAAWAREDARRQLAGGGTAPEGDR